MKNNAVVGRTEEGLETTPEWLPLPEEPIIELGEIHVFRALGDADPKTVASLEMVLSDTERERAGRFRFDRDRIRYTLSYGILRRILGAYLKTPPETIRIVPAEHGKPVLDPAFHSLDLQFNLSHTKGVSLFALASGMAVGIDVERTERESHSDIEVAERYFTEGEFRALRSLPEHGQRQAFFRCWTRKEAFVKALGRGLSFGLDRFEVSVEPGHSAALLKTFWDPEEAAFWSIVEVAPGAGYVGALAVRSRDIRLRYFDCSPVP